VVGRESVRDELAARLPAELLARVEALAHNARPPNPRARKKPPSFADWKAGETPIEDIRRHAKSCRDVRAWAEGGHRLYGYLGDGTLTVVDLAGGRVVYHGPPPAWYPDEVMTQIVLDRPAGEC
jgi:hypothetical protein